MSYNAKETEWEKDWSDVKILLKLDIERKTFLLQYGAVAVFFFDFFFFVFYSQCFTPYFKKTKLEENYELQNFPVDCQGFLFFYTNRGPAEGRAVSHFFK